MSPLQVHPDMLAAMAVIAARDGRDARIETGHPGRTYLTVDGWAEAWAPNDTGRVRACTCPAGSPLHFDSTPCRTNEKGNE